MTPEQVKLVQQSFESVAPIADTAADMFYARLFEIAPELRPLFPEDMREQKSKLMRMLSVAVRNLHQLDAVLPAVKELGARHVAYGVTDAQYAPVGAALLHTLALGLGDAWTPQMEEAWTATYMAVAGVMKDAAAEASKAAATA